MPILEINRFEGMLNRIAKQKQPIYTFPLLENVVASEVEGQLLKRRGYASVISAGLTDLQMLFEFRDSAGNVYLVFTDGDTLKYIPYSSGYGSIATFTDERSGTVAIDGDNFSPTTVYDELRGGVGVPTTNPTYYKPVWIGWIPGRSRFNASESISEGAYLDEQDYRDKLEDLISVEMQLANSYKTSHTIGGGFYTVYVSPVIDGYQRGFPTKDKSYIPAGSNSINYVPAGDADIQKNIAIDIVISDANALKAKRVTALDVFVANALNSLSDLENSPAYFLQRIDLNDDSDVFFETTGTLDNTGGSEKITIADYADFLSFPLNELNGFHIHDVTNDVHYRVTAISFDGTDVDLTTTPVAQDSGSASLRFYSRWYDNGSNEYVFSTFYDDDYKKLRDEMYEYLGIPTGDEGLSDYRYKFAAWAGRRLFVSGFNNTSDDTKNALHYSVVNNPDVIPVLNKARLRKSPTGMIDLADESVMVFYKDSADRVEVFGNQNHRITDNFLNYGCVGQRAIIKITDSLIAFMSYTGPVLMSGFEAFPIGDAIYGWWDVGGNLTDAQKEACIVTYNHYERQVYFSFPSYTTSPYTTGVVFVFDLRAWEQRKVSAWFILKSDKKILSATLADNLHLITGDATSIVDWNSGSPTESVQAKVRLKLLQNPLMAALINMERVWLHFTDSGGNTVTCNLYIDESGTASLTFTPSAGRTETIIEYLGETLELELLSAAGTQDWKLNTILIEYQDMDR